MPKKRRPCKGIKKKYIIIPAATLGAVLILYLTAIFAPIPFVVKWRDIWIETAMTTADHQWLATAFIPKFIIDRVMEKKNTTSDVIGGGDHLNGSDKSDDTKAPDPPVTEPDDTTSGLPDTPEVPGEDDKDDILGQKKLKVGDTDYAGYKVLVNDIDEGIVISEITGDGYRGKIMLIDDPSRVYLGTTTMKNEEGLRIKTMMEHYGAVAGINASGFADPNDSGTGGEVMGMSYDGEFWGEYVDFYGSILITSDDKLVVGNVKDWDKYDIRAGIQFGPVLIADGKAAIEGTGGYGIQPRTAIGQREDGVIVFLVIDGRKVGWSLGCTMDDLISILTKYEVVNAACCDGGSSSVLAYKGEVITKNSSLNPDFGRRLPNAFLVKPKEKSSAAE